MGRNYFNTVAIGLALATTITITGCSANGEPGATDPSIGGSGPSTTARPGTDGSGGSGGVAGSRINLIRFTGCDDVLNYVKSEALGRVGPYGLDGEQEIVYAEDSFGGETDGTMANGTAPASAAADSSDLDEGLTSETGTNVQEAGVDEPDIIKTDGTRIITLSSVGSGSVLTVADITEGPPKATGTLRLDNQGADMVLSGDRIMVFSRGGDYFGPVGTGDAEEAFVGDEALPAWSSRTVITEVSIAAEPTVVNTMAIEGNFLSGRSIGNRLRVAVSSPPVSLPWVLPQNEAGRDRAEESNRQVIEDSTLDDWLPDVSINGAAATSLLDCDSIHRPAEFAGFDTVSIIDLDLDAGLGAPTDAVGVMASGETTYSSTDRFYVASTDWNWDVVDPDTDTTAADVAPGVSDVTTDVHAFAISDTEPTSYVASGEVPGALLNQFAMDSSGGNLRIVTTSTGADGGTETFLRVLNEQGDRLTEIGSVGGLGKGEQLYSARLFDEIGFAVTFRQIDPLYVLDLADPTAPRVSGELKIPGVSTYLHPIGDGRLLGVGAAATDDGARTGLKVSLFDFSDVANPTEVANWTLDGAGSDAEYDAHAFHYSDGLLVLPLANFFWDGQGEPAAPSAVVLRVDDTITEVGRISADIVETEPSSDCRAVDGDTPGADGPLSIYYGDNAYLQVCGPDDVGGYGDYQCESRSYDELVPGTIAPEDNAELDLREGDRLEICYPGESFWDNQIRRVIDVNDTFYTLTNSRLQANDRTSLDLLGSIKVGP